MVKGVVSRGHGVASGKGNDPRYPGGTLELQAPLFKNFGLDISPFYPGTINLDISPYRFTVLSPKHYFKHIAWSSYIPPENFYFFDVVVHFCDKTYAGLIYMPDPETKTDHHQMPHMLELLLPKIVGLNYGDHLKIKVPEEQLQLYKID